MAFSKKKEKPKEVKLSRWQRLRRQHRISLFLLPFFIFIPFSLFAVYGIVNPIAWLYALVLAMLIALIAIAEGAAR